MEWTEKVIFRAVSLGELGAYQTEVAGRKARREGREGRERRRRRRGEITKGGMEEEGRGKRTVVPDKSQSAGSHISKMLEPRRDLPRGLVVVVVVVPLADAGSKGSSSASLRLRLRACCC